MKHVEIECCLQQRMKTFRFRKVTFRYLKLYLFGKLSLLSSSDHPKGDKHPRLFHVRFPRVINASTVRKYKFVQPLIEV